MSSMVGWLLFMFALGIIISPALKMLLVKLRQLRRISLDIQFELDDNIEINKRHNSAISTGHALKPAQSHKAFEKDDLDK